MGRQVNFKKISSKIFTLSYPKYRIVIFLIILILLAILPTEIISKTHSFSLCSMALGKYCYSTGITRGISSLLKGDFYLAMEYNPLSILVLLMLVGFVIHDIIRVKRKIS